MKLSRLSEVLSSLPCAGYKESQGLEQHPTECPTLWPLRLISKPLTLFLKHLAHIFSAWKFINGQLISFINLTWVFSWNKGNVPVSCFQQNKTTKPQKWLAFPTPLNKCIIQSTCLHCTHHAKTQRTSQYSQNNPCFHWIMCKLVNTISPKNRNNRKTLVPWLAIVSCYTMNCQALWHQNFS